MDSEYNILECLPDGSVLWRDTASGRVSARRKLQKLGEDFGGEYFAMVLPTREVVFRVEGAPTGKRVFQIAYTEKLGNKRAELLRRHGYGVLTVVGNNAAKAALTAFQLRPEDVSFFIVGHAAPESGRKEMVDWLKARYPRVPILVLNPPNQQIPAADHNVLQNGPELWLPLFAQPSIDAATNQ